MEHSMRLLILNTAIAYGGRKLIVGRENESEGRIAMKYTGRNWLGVHPCDCFA